MPAATFNHDRAAGQQHHTPRNQIYQDMREDDSNTAQQAHDLAQQYNQDLLNGVTRTTPSIETFVMSMALEQEVDLSSLSTFSLASQGNPLLPLATSAQAGQQGSQSIDQTQLLSGSRP